MTNNSSKSDSQGSTSIDSKFFGPHQRLSFEIKNNSRNEDTFPSFAVKYIPNTTNVSEGLIRASVISLDENYNDSLLKGAFGQGIQAYLVDTFLPDGTPAYGDIDQKGYVATKMLAVVQADAVKKGCKYLAFRDSHPYVQEFLRNNGFIQYEHPVNEVVEKELIFDFKDSDSHLPELMLEHGFEYSVKILPGPLGKKEKFIAFKESDNRIKDFLLEQGVETYKSTVFDSTKTDENHTLVPTTIFYKQL